ncbi:uncharacterized protein LOC110051862 [Orbicella faveolata]|uniref:uncharacterized protein LOC110051854 n=1 Tax=Orbicella faveolata TaxID=48498 RepID=UPI0009E5CAE0|nr:uncharacterized protein LOC110051854 [Orbicella faveolata]XP_020613601.1 uncharacterized protein LOC110051862 [Orbicella faveolata]
MPVWSLWYLLLALILFHSVFCSEAHNKGSTVKQHKESLLKFFKLNDENPTSENATLNITNSPGRCGLLTKKLCAQKHKSKSNTVKKSFRPYYYDDDDDEDSDDYDETADDDDFPEETETGSYRSYAPRDHERPYDDESEDYDRESWRGQNFDDEDSEPRERPGYEGDMDDWDWDSPRRHGERHTFKDRERWRSHDVPQDDDEFEPSYSTQYRHHPRHSHYRHYHHQYRPPVHASYRTFSQAAPSWPTYFQEYSRRSPFAAPVPYVTNPASVDWTRGLASYQPRWQPRYYPPVAATSAPQSFNTRLAGPSSLNPYQQNILSYQNRESNSFFIPPYHVSSPSYLRATTRNLVDFTIPNSLPGVAASSPRLSHHIYHYPPVVSHSRHIISPFSRPFIRRREFSDAVLNRLRDMNLH